MPCYMSAAGRPPPPLPAALPRGLHHRGRVEESEERVVPRAGDRVGLTKEREATAAAASEQQ